MARVYRLLGLALALPLAVGCRAPAPTPTPAEPDGGEQPEPTPELPLTQPPPTCDGEPCEPPRECIRYHGIAGPSGPTFHACEIRCEPELSNGGCPDGMRCVTIADGPGDVCQPSD